MNKDFCVFYNLLNNYFFGIEFTNRLIINENEERYVLSCSYFLILLYGLNLF